MQRTRMMVIPVIWTLAWAPQFGHGAPVGNEFTYQGQLSVAGQPASGSYDMCFGLWDSATGGSQIGTLQYTPGVPLADGLFTVTLNATGVFGTNAFNGQERWLQIGVAPPGSTSYTTLAPRQKITATPYALFSTAPWASSAGNISYTGGNVGIGTASPSSKLTVAGLIQSTTGGFKFPDGTVQVTAGGAGFSLPYDGTAATSGAAFSATNSSGTIAVRGLATNTGGAINYGGYFEAYGTSGRGVAGAASGANARGVYGFATAGGGIAGYFENAPASTAPALQVIGYGVVQAREWPAYGSESPLFLGDGNHYIKSVAGQGVRLGTYGVPDGVVLQESTGNVGIGTTVPQTRLDVDGGNILVRGPDSFDATGEEATVWLGDANHYIKGVYGKGVTIGTWYVGDVMYVTEPYGWIGINTDQPQADLHVNGRTRTNVLEIVGGADLAEPFVVNERSAVSDQQSAISDQRSAVNQATGTADTSTHHSSPITHHSTTIQPGMVVVIDPENPGQLKLAAEAYDRKVAGVISGAKGLKPGMIMRDAGTAQADGDHPVALSGRVWCWCDAKYGPVVPGDRLTPSATPGHAMKVTDRDRADGAVLGKAMTSLERGTGLVLVLVTLQ